MPPEASIFGAQSTRPLPSASALIEAMADWLEMQEDLSYATLLAGPPGQALTHEQLEFLADNPAERDIMVTGLRQSVLAAQVIEARREADRRLLALQHGRQGAHGRPQRFGPRSRLRARLGGRLGRPSDRAALVHAGGTPCLRAPRSVEGGETP